MPNAKYSTPTAVACCTPFLATATLNLFCDEFVTTVTGHLGNGPGFHSAADAARLPDLLLSPMLSEE
jgi:hypothetical protein